MNSVQHFRQLHTNATPLIIAKIFQKMGYAAVGTSSAALANTYGFADGETMPFQSIVSMAKNIVSAVSIPVTVDIEGGFARKATKIAGNIEKLHDVGVVGINLEDTLPNPNRHLQDIAVFQRILSETANILKQKNVDIFINLRTDGFLLGLPNALEETLNRIKAYENAGADGIFVPCITNVNDIEAVVKSTHLPINVMAMPNLPDFATLQNKGVKRISMGNSLHQYLNRVLSEKAKAILDNQGFSPIF
jgi:2-methylisocitrate lyase-like PEP mutase family enzyme